MKTEIIHILILSGAFLVLFATGELCYHVFKWKGEHSRKLVHAGTGILTLLFPVYLSSHWSVLLLCASFAGILFFSLKYNFLKSINDIDRPSYGSLAYPLAVYISFLYLEFVRPELQFFYMPVLFLALCDPVAALIGKKFPWKKFKVGSGHKTVSGTLAFAVMGILSCCLAFYLATGQIDLSWSFISGVLILSCWVALFEAVSRKGWDNLLIPLGTMAGIEILHYIG